MNDKFSYSLSHLMTLCNKTMILDLPGESTNTLHLIQCLFKVTVFFTVVRFRFLRPRDACPITWEFDVQARDSAR